MAGNKDCLSLLGKSLSKKSPIHPHQPVKGSSRITVSGSPRTPAIPNRCRISQGELTDFSLLNLIQCHLRSKSTLWLEIPPAAASVPDAALLCLGLIALLSLSAYFLMGSPTHAATIDQHCPAGGLTKQDHFYGGGLACTIWPQSQSPLPDESPLTSYQQRSWSHTFLVLLELNHPLRHLCSSNVSG